MVTLLKILIIITALAVFGYAAALALQGDLESEIIMRDYITAKSYVIQLLCAYSEKYF